MGDRRREMAAIIHQYNLLNTWMEGDQRSIYLIPTQSITSYAASVRRSFPEIQLLKDDLLMYVHGGRRQGWVGMSMR